MAYSTAQARKIAEQIHSRFGRKIANACQGTPVPPAFLAGLVGVEAGKDRNGQLKEDATRFEPHVFAALKAVRDGQRRSYSRITRAQIQDSSDAALRALATSYGLCQVMGWHCINSLDCSIAELRDPDKHLRYAVNLLLLNASGGDFERAEYAGEFRQWNTGSESGKTYHADYVANAGAVMAAYRELPTISAAPATAEPSAEAETVSSFPPAQPPESATSAADTSPAPPVENAPQGHQAPAPAPPETGVIQSAGKVVVEAARSQTAKEKAWAWLTGGGFLAVLNYFEERPALVLAAGVVAGLLIYHFTARIRQKSQQAHELTKLKADINTDKSRLDVEVVKQ